PGVFDDKVRFGETVSHRVVYPHRINSVCNIIKNTSCELRVGIVKQFVSVFGPEPAAPAEHVGCTGISAVSARNELRCSIIRAATYLRQQLSDGGNGIDFNGVVNNDFIRARRAVPVFECIEYRNEIPSGTGVQNLFFGLSANGSVDGCICIACIPGVGEAWISSGYLCVLIVTNENSRNKRRT